MARVTLVKRAAHSLGLALFGTVVAHAWAPQIEDITRSHITPLPIIHDSIIDFDFPSHKISGASHCRRYLAPHPATFTSWSSIYQSAFVSEHSTLR